jgi:hypothetical protein
MIHRFMSESGAVWVLQFETKEKEVHIELRRSGMHEDVQQTSGVVRLPGMRAVRGCARTRCLFQFRPRRSRPDV